MAMGDIMNYYIDAQITNMITMAKTFEASCKMAATKNDGTIDPTEEKQIKKLSKITERFISELELLR